MAAAISGSPEPKEFPDWVLLQPTGRTHCYADADAAAAAVENDPTAVAVETSNNQQSGYFSFTLSPPLTVSYLDLHWPHGMPTSSPGNPRAYSCFVSVDESLLLIRVDLQHPRGLDWFVYSSSSSPRPSPRRLPACDKELHGLAGRSRFLQLDTDIGILRRGGGHGGGEDDYVVADLAVSWKARGSTWSFDDCGYYDYNDPPPMTAVLCAFSSKTGEWTATEMAAPQPGGQDQFPVLWSCDTVVPFAGRYLCWVDYYSGLLIRDFSDEASPAPPRLVYVPFLASGEQFSDKTRVERNFPEASRRVAVSHGKMRFVHIGDDCHRRDGGRRGGPWRASRLKITVWNLEMTDDSGGRWDVDREVILDDLWAHPGYSLLRRAPEFPLVIKDDPDVLCCALREDEFDGKAWIIMLDMKRAELLSSIPYTIEEIEDGDIVRQYEIVSHLVGSLIPSDFSRYLKNPR